MQISEPAEYIILGLLKKHPMHGYEMFQQMGSSVLSQVLHLEMSQMYAYLKKLEKLEYIETRLEAQGPRPPRKVHHLTAQGDRAFMQWLTTPVEKPRDIRILFLIKLYFIRQLLPYEVTTLIAQQMSACQRFLEGMETAYAVRIQHVDEQEQREHVEHEASRESDDDIFFNHIVLQSRIYQTRALLDWLQELRIGDMNIDGKNDRY